MEAAAMRYRMGFVASFMLLIGGVLLNRTFAQEAATQPSHAGPTTSMQGAKTPAELAQIFKQRFDDASDEQIRKYMSGDDAGDAIAAGWEMVRRSVNVAKANAQGEVQAAAAQRRYVVVHPDKDALSHFIEIVDARTGGAPTVFRNAVATCSADTGYMPPGAGYGPDGPTVGFSGIPGQTVSNSATVQRVGTSNNVVVIVDQSNQWTVPLAGDSATAVLTDGIAYLASYSSYPARPYPLYAIDRKTNAQIWKTQEWSANGSTPQGGNSGHASGKVELKISGDCLVVFGVAYNGADIERFDLKTGNNLSRFCTKYYAYDK
jgi:hypothetical protein